MVAKVTFKSGIERTLDLIHSVVEEPKVQDGDYSEGDTVGVLYDSLREGRCGLAGVEDDEEENQDDLVEDLFGRRVSALT